MRSVTLPGTDLSPAPLGMGCASLGSRYGAAEGSRALAAAFDRGVTWFDVAPAYGAGEAEMILGRFVRGRREHVQLCTKVGLAPPRYSVARKLLMPIGRPMMARLKSLRGAVRRSGATGNTRLPLTPALIEQSITRSLARLGTDHVEVFALHHPLAEELSRDDVLRALEQVVERGQARYLAVAGDLSAGLAGAAAGCFRLVQLADDPITGPLAQVRSAGLVAMVSHSILGVGGALARLTEQFARQPALAQEARAAGFDSAAALLMARAFASNPDGVVLASMFAPGNLAANAVAAELPLARAQVAALLVARGLG